MSLVPGLFQVTPAVTASAAYASGNCVGGVQAIGSPDAGRNLAELDSVTIFDAGNQKAPLTILFFKSDPTLAGAPATVTDKAAFAWGTSGPLFVGKLDFAGADYETFAGKAVACKALQKLPLQLSGTGKQLYAVVVTTGTPTYATVSDLVFTYGFAPIND